MYTLGDPLTIKALGILDNWYKTTFKALEDFKRGDQTAYFQLVDLLEWADSDEARQICKTIGLIPEFLNQRVQTFKREVVQ